MIVKYGSVVLVGSLLAQGFAPGCAAHDRVSDTLAEPWHVHYEIPTGGDRVNVTSSMAASGSNVTVGVSYVKLGGDIRCAKE